MRTNRKDIVKPAGSPVKYLDKLLKQQSDVVDKYCNSSLPKTKKKEVHEIRVAIKKLNSMFKLLEFVASLQFDRKSYSDEYRKVYKKLGKLRELQVTNDYLEKYKLPKGLAKLCDSYYKYCEKKARQKLSKTHELFNREKFKSSVKAVNNFINELDEPRILKKANEFILLETNEIKKLLQEKDTPENIHQIRKHVKSVNYNMTFLNNVRPLVKYEKLVSELGKTSALLGLWHDRIILSLFISDFMEEHKKSPDEYLRFLKKVMKDIEGRNRKTLKRIKPRLENIYELVMETV
jgi:CHAD domain-containing protein